MLRYLRAAMLLGGLAIGTALGAAEPPELSEPPETVVDYQDGTYVGRLRMRVPVRREVALAVLTDFENMENFVPNLSSSRIVRRNGNVYVVAQEGKADFGPFSYRFTSERRIEVLPEGRIRARAVSGTVKAMSSELTLLAAGPTATLIDYRIESTPDVWLLPSALGVGFLRHELDEQFTAIAREMLRRNGRSD